MRQTAFSFGALTRGGSFALTLVIFTCGFILGNLVDFRTVALADTDQAFEPFWDAFSLIESRYVDQVEVELLVNGAIDGMVDSLGDDHSGYIRPELYERSVDFSGEYTGIGVFIDTDEDTGEISVVDCHTGVAG